MKSFLGYVRDGKGIVVRRHFQNHANTVHTQTGGGGNTDCFCIELTRVRRPVLRKERTEEGRRMRKAYESKEIGYSGGMRMAVPRTDGLCNTITTVTKDNLLLEVEG